MFANLTFILISNTLSLILRNYQEIINTDGGAVDEKDIEVTIV